MRSGNSKRPVAVCIVAIILFIILALMTYRDRTAGNEETLFHAAADPVVTLVNDVTDTVSDFFVRVFSPNEIQRENKELKDRIAYYERELLLYEETARENARLQDLLDYVQQNENMRYLTACVTARSLNGYVNSLTLNVGTRHGVSENIPVVTGMGLIGRVTEVGNSWCKVHTLMNDEMRISVMVERTRQEGTLGGLIQQNGETVGIQLYYLPENADIVIGDRIITSGIGGVYPKGLLIGTVVSLPEEENTAYDACVFPEVDFSEPENVLLIMGVDEVRDD